MKKEIDIIDFVNEWLDTNGVLNQEQDIIKFVEQLQKQISQMDYSLPENGTIIGYTGKSKGKDVYLIVGKATKASENNAKYISNLPAGKLLNNEKFKEAMLNLFDQNENDVAKIVNGCDISNGGWENAVRLEGGSCGYGSFPALDDFISAKLMGEATGVSNNIIIFAPENIDSTKVFATTEIEQIFKNSTFEYINGIPKSELEAIYRAGETGKQSFFEIINQTAKQAVGDAKDIDPQASKLLDAFSEMSIPTKYVDMVVPPKI